MSAHAPHRPSGNAARPEGQSSWLVDWARAWDSFWFKPSDPVVVGLIRFCTGLVVVYAHLMYSFDLLSYVGKDAWVDDGARSAAHYLRYELPFMSQSPD